MAVGERKHEGKRIRKWSPWTGTCGIRRSQWGEGNALYSARLLKVGKNTVHAATRTVPALATNVPVNSNNYYYRYYC